MLLASAWLFTTTGLEWYWFWVFLLLPDVSMIGYLINPKIGAWLYNLVHHRLFGLALVVIGWVAIEPWISGMGIICFGHTAMDRIFGYGLKFEDSFHHTHLGWIKNDAK